MKRQIGGRPLAALATAAMLGLGAGACGDDEGSEEAGSSDEPVTAVTLTATEYEFEVSETPTAETETVSFENDGEEFHVFVFARINEGYTVEEAIELEGEKGSAELVGQAEAEPGEDVEVKIKEPLEPGEYAMLCPLRTKEGEPHYELGQLVEFSLE